MTEFGYYLEAEYKSGYVHSNEHQDISPYTLTTKVNGVATGYNILNDIINKRPSEFHGSMVRWSLIGPNKRWDIDWTTLPDNARPIYLRDMEQDFNVSGGTGETRIIKQDFGYQYNDEDGRNHKEIKEII